MRLMDNGALTSSLMAETPDDVLGQGDTTMQPMFCAKGFA